MKNLFKTLMLFSIITSMLLSCKFSGHNNTVLENTIDVSFVSVLPDEYNNDNSKRSAIPEFSDSTLLYNVTATYTDSDGQAVTINRTDCKREFTLPLVPEKNYTITVKAFDKDDTTKATLFIGTKDNILVDSLITGTNGPFSIPLQIYKENGNLKEGLGSLKLHIMTDYEVGSEVYGYDWNLSGNGLNNSDPGKGNFARRSIQTISLSNIPASINPYDLFINFYKGTEIVYQFHTDVMIFAGTETNTWKNELELETVTNSETGKEEDIVVISQAFVDAYTAKYFYVCNNAPNGSTQTEDGQGTYESPWYDLNNAIDKILSINNGSTKYTIYILGDLTGSYNISKSGTLIPHTPGHIDYTIPSSNEKNIDILIQGIGTQKTLASDSTEPEISIINSSSKNVSFEFVNLKCIHKIEATNANIKLTNVSAPEIDFSNTNATLVGIDSSSELVSGNNITLDSNCTIKIGGKEGYVNNIRKLYLPKDGSGNQIKLQILNEDSDSSPLTLNGSTIGINLESEPDATNQYVIFTEGFAQATNTSDLPNTIFNIFSNPDGFNVGAVAPLASEPEKYEACIAISSGSISIGYMDDIVFSAENTTIESKALDANDSGITIPGGYTAKPRTITISATKDGNSFAVSNLSSLSLKLISPQTNSVITTNSGNSNTITIPYGITEGTYILRVFGLYNSAGYSTDFPITVVNNVEFMSSKTMLVKDGTAAEKTLTVYGSYNSNNLTIGSLDSTTTSFSITEGSAATITLSSSSSACGHYSVNLYGKYNELYFRETFTFDVIQFDFSCTETGTNEKSISVKIKTSNNSSDDIILNPESDFNINIKKVTGSGSSVVETEIYIYDDISIDSLTHKFIYTIPDNLPAGSYRIYITGEYNGITKTESFAFTK